MVPLAARGATGHNQIINLIVLRPWAEGSETGQAKRVASKREGGLDKASSRIRQRFFVCVKQAAG